MPKMKTNRGAAKRFRTTGTGRVKRAKSGMRHILTSKASGRKRGLRKSALVSPSDEGAIKRLIPYK